MRKGFLNNFHPPSSTSIRPISYSTAPFSSKSSPISLHTSRIELPSQQQSHPNIESTEQFPSLSRAQSVRQNATTTNPSSFTFPLPSESLQNNKNTSINLPISICPPSVCQNSSITIPPSNTLSPATTPSTNTKATNPTTKSFTWNNIYRDLRSHDSTVATSSIKLIEKIGRSTQGGIYFSEEELEGGCKKWQYSLIGKFLSRTPSLEWLKAEVPKKWKTKNPVHIMDLARGFYVFRFANEEDKQAILTAGPWTMRGQPLHLFSWKPGFNPLTAEITVSPIWIQIPSLPLELRTPESLAAIGREFGTVLKIDDHTLQDVRGVYCRVCVEIDLSTPLKNGLWIKRIGGEYFQHVQYENLPITCFKCGKMGHRMNACSSSHDIDATSKSEGSISLQNSNNNVEEFLEDNFVSGPWIHAQRRIRRPHLQGNAQRQMKSNIDSDPIQHSSKVDMVKEMQQNETQNTMMVNGKTKEVNETAIPEVLTGTEITEFEMQNSFQVLAEENASEILHQSSGITNTTIGLTGPVVVESTLKSPDIEATFQQNSDNMMEDLQDTESFATYVNKKHMYKKAEQKKKNLKNFKDKLGIRTTKPATPRKEKMIETSKTIDMTSTPRTEATNETTQKDKPTTSGISTSTTKIPDKLSIEDMLEMGKECGIPPEAMAEALFSSIDDQLPDEI